MGRWEGQVSGTVVISATVVLNVCPCCTADPLSVLVQFSLMDRTGAPRGAGSTKELVEMLKFGLGALLESTDSKDEDIDFEEILGRSERGEWVETGLEGRRGCTALEGGGSRTEGVFAFDSFCAAAVCVFGGVCVCALGGSGGGVRACVCMSMCTCVCACLCGVDTIYTPATVFVVSGPDNIYVFEGEDYSKVVPESDRRTFDQLLAERMEELECGLKERALRSENKASSCVGCGGMHLHACVGVCLCVHPCCGAGFVEKAFSVILLLHHLILCS